MMIVILTAGFERNILHEIPTMIGLHHEAEPSKALARNYDYVIVGAGSAGCVVARRLLDGTNATVLLLEPTQTPPAS